MAIYHLSAKIVSRQSGRSVVAAAAYRSGQSLTEDATGIDHNYTRKEGVEHSEILAPEGAPDWVLDRSALWNAVEAVEKRRDAQLAREIEIGLPIELENDEQLALLRAYVKREFVARGMVADFSIHRDDPNNPHSHVLLTMRRLTEKGFGPKERSWNERAKLMAWREGWEEVTNAHLARAGLAVRIDHRSLKAQGSHLEPGRKIGVGLERQKALGLPDRIAERVSEQREIARENGERILQDPGIALKGLTHGQATFTRQDLARYLHTRTEGAEQFQAAMLKVSTSEELVPLGRDEKNNERFTSRSMLALESQLLRDSGSLHQRAGHAVGEGPKRSALSQARLSQEQHQAFDALVGKGDLKALIGVAGSGKSRLLAAARFAWEAEGFTVKGAALSGIAAENLQLASGISSRTLASFEWHWARGREPLTKRDVIVVDEAGMVGTRQFAGLLEAAEKAHAKVVLVGDTEQLQAIEAGAPFRAIVSEAGAAELGAVQRQKVDWQREATREFAAGETAAALERYDHAGALVQVATREAARTALIARWAKEAERHPKESRLMLAYTREDVRELNSQARALRLQRGERGRSEAIQTVRGEKDFAVNDRILFLRNEKSLGVKNGSIGTVEAVREGIMQVVLDGTEQRVALDTRFYQDLDHGYAATVYKAQGSTVDRTYLLATPHYDRHAAYVALSRHRETTTLFYAAEDFGGVPDTRAGEAVVKSRLFETLSRARPKDLVHDYLERAPESERSERAPAYEASSQSHPTLEETRRQGREAWLTLRAVEEARARAPSVSALQPDAPGREPSDSGSRASTLEEQRAAGREAWLKMRREGPLPPSAEQDKGKERDREQDLERGGPELEL